MSYAVGVDAGGTNIKAVAVTPAGEIIARTAGPTEDGKRAWSVGADPASDASLTARGRSLQPWASRIKDRIAELERAAGAPASWVGMAAPGFAAPDSSRIVWMGGRMEWLVGVEWGPALGRPAPVPVLNDANAALLGETWLGAAKGARNAVLLTLGTGVGGAVLVAGKLLRGAVGRAGHLGHLSLDPDGGGDICRTPGSLENAIGECTLAARGGGRFASTEALVAAHLAGDKAAGVVWTRAVRALAAGIAGLINVLDPEVVILGGGIAKAGAALFDPLQARLDEIEWRPLGGGVRIVPASLGDLAGALGAAYHAMSERTRSGMGG